ncbi:uncharacterized protein LOC127388724 [Apus apus]|uniref:uncharacterized protein LOC127388724 n=1 Tax=Apus apus TaxID=8895 RepID=UPI0021F8D0B5|nr:uncharacterized protein LOC127388724 [Apus apus]
MNLLSQVSSSRQAVAGVTSTAAFFLCEELLGQHFDVVPDGVAEPQPGDLFLFPLASGGLGWWGAHAGVYCGDGEIIHLEGTSRLGIVSKHGKRHLLRARGPAKVLRRRAGLDVAALRQRVRAAMDQALEYDPVTCNCIHFALTLLGLGHLASAMVGASTLGTPMAGPTKCHHSPSPLPGVPSTAVTDVAMCPGNTLQLFMKCSSMVSSPQVRSYCQVPAGMAFSPVLGIPMGPSRHSRGVGDHYSLGATDL